VHPKNSGLFKSTIGSITNGLGFLVWVQLRPNIPIDRYDTVKAESYQEKLTFPPFTSNRVVEQFSFVRVGNEYAESPLSVLPHGIARKRSETNLRRRVENFSSSACFVWYSANTLANGRGSVMVYNVASDRPDRWFAAFSREQGWKVHDRRWVGPKGSHDL
jgi:hypothetical protein